VDGSKEPEVAGWREFATRRPTAAERRRWFDRPGPAGIGVTGGAASGNLIVLDIESETAYDRWLARLAPADLSVLSRGPLVRAPRGGCHIYVRTAEPVKGCKLARSAGGTCVLETRGSQHFVVGPGSPVAVHRSGCTYRLERVGWLDGRPAEPVALEEFFRWTVAAADLNEYARPRRVVGESRPQGGTPTGDRPGDHFNVRVGWADILTRHGWRVFSRSGDTTYWTRPGKAEGVSASTGFCKGETAGDLLYVFSTSAAPFEAEVSYSKFAAYALLEHGGDFATATRRSRPPSPRCAPPTPGGTCPPFGGRAT
jgi:hypothetical protein